MTLKSYKFCYFRVWRWIDVLKKYWVLFRAIGFRETCFQTVLVKTVPSCYTNYLLYHLYWMLTPRPTQCIKVSQKYGRNIAPFALNVNQSCGHTRRGFNSSLGQGIFRILSLSLFMGPWWQVIDGACRSANAVILSLEITSLSPLWCTLGLRSVRETGCTPQVKELPVTRQRSVVLSGYSGFLHP